MVEAMLVLLQERGYAGTGVNAVLEAGAAPKGSLYFHFPEGKESLGVRAVELAAEQYRAVIAAAAAAGDAAEAVGHVLDQVAEELVAADFAAGCPVAVVTLETSAHSDRLRAACEAAYDSWIALVREHLVAHGVAPGEATALAETVVSTVEGAMIVSRARRDVGPVRSARQVLVDLLRTRLADVDGGTGR